MIGKQVLAFGKSEKSEFINIVIFAASLGGRKGRRQIGRDHMYAFIGWSGPRGPLSDTLVHRDIQLFDLHLRQFQIARDSEVQGSPI